MQSTSITRKTDDLGRISIPKEIRRMMRIEHGDKVEIHIDGDRILLTKHDDTTVCDVTGKPATFSLLDGKINLSQEGCLALLAELKSHL